jgi:ParB family chromosome partitioning protein
MKAQGILAPLLVRELEESKYEVVAGARRLRAAKLAELELVPVRVVKLTDAESVEAQVVENLQREDIHPLEESLGFKSLLQLGEPVYTIASIAARAGKSEAYVHGRIKLADLIPSVAEAFLKDTIAIGHALLIAKLPDSQQQEAFNAAFRGMWTTDGNSQVLIPVRELAAWIESNILLQLASAPFDKQDEALVPAAGSCSNCAKRTGYKPGDHGSTFGGNPLGCAVARAALRVLIDEKMVQRSAELGSYFLALLKTMRSRHLKEVRGIGLWIGIELHVPARPYCEDLRAEGVLCKETHDRVIRIAPPLVIERAEIDWAFERIRKVVEKLG